MTDAQTPLRDIDKPHYNYFQALYLSFFSNRLYIDVGRRWKGFAITYLLLLFLITSLPVFVRIFINFNDYFEQQITLPIKSLPPFYVQNGEVILDKPMPYLVKNREGKIIAAVDTTGTIKQIDSKYPDLAILIVKDGLFYRIPESQGLNNIDLKIDKIPFDKNMNQYFDGSQWLNTSGVQKLKLFSQVIIYPTIVLSLFFMYLAILFILALLGQVIALAIFRYSISYGQAVRLLNVSATPHIVFLMILITFNWLFMGFGLALVIILAFYFCYALLALKRDSTKLVHV
ncbi:Protein of uncharacterised function (DUF1189) [Legionella busanensis]|uniref:Protein of uncharacterized function (DUF1189) n=1 Tax=Legionella busanensis TaxID=190655 RepID=A0A378JM64_9GAMM|nr:DUF1189 family protein [Legionella busanensis]STX51831.1 Protein of uncharacterised function (DUF1189) [Legionella busanensis]